MKNLRTCFLVFRLFTEVLNKDNYHKSDKTIGKHIVFDEDLRVFEDGVCVLCLVAGIDQEVVGQDKSSLMSDDVLLFLHCQKIRPIGLQSQSPQSNSLIQPRFN
ncbi:hypothetical protein ACLB2K_029879 [Fragaria x ananassa]